MRFESSCLLLCFIILSSNLRILFSQSSVIEVLPQLYLLHTLLTVFLARVYMAGMFWLFHNTTFLSQVCVVIVITDCFRCEFDDFRYSHYLEIFPYKLSHECLYCFRCWFITFNISVSTLVISYASTISWVNVMTHQRRGVF